MKRLIPLITVFVLSFVGVFLFLQKTKKKERPVKTDIVSFKGTVPPKHTRPIAAPGVCSFEGAVAFTEDMEVMAATVYGGKSLNFQIDQSGHEARQVDVTVNSEKPVALILAAYEPTVWNIGWTKNTKITAVHLNGVHRQVAAGLPEGTPVLSSNSTYHGPCPQISDTSSEAIIKTSYNLFGKSVSQRFKIVDAAVLMGNALKEGDEIITSSWKTIQTYREDKAPLAGPMAIQESVKQGFLRQPTEEDLKVLKHDLLTNHPGETAILPPAAYLVVKDFTCPEGLYGANSVSLIVMKGVNRPLGDCGHSEIYDMNKTPVCVGPSCVTNQKIINVWK
ncbi:MAG: hypothetical protein V4598_06330 [Bdellovibrionota bacterium]